MDQLLEVAFMKMEQLICTTPVLEYNNLQMVRPIQCDSNQRGLGAVLLQEGNQMD